MINLVISDSANLLSSQELMQAAESTLAMVGKFENTELTIAIQTDVELQQLNRDFLGLDTPTDVLSFPADEFDPDSQSQYLGDVIISIQRADAQAKSAGHPLINELQLLVIHGVLHLLGYDHSDEKQKQQMWEMQTAVLRQIGCVINKLPE